MRTGSFARAYGIVRSKTTAYLVRRLYVIASERRFRYFRKIDGDGKQIRVLRRDRRRTKTEMEPAALR